MVKNNKKILPLTGAQAVAEAMRQINPGVVAMYPITPQTQIVEAFAKYHADGIVDTEVIRVESEHSAMSAVLGASASGVRAMTATSSNGLELMHEVVAATPGMRLPVVMPIVNRAVSSPINIHCDHSDSMACRDLGWIQIFSETAQEAYENTLLALRLSEKCLFPSMVMQDGFITSHSVENVEIFSDSKVKKFIGQYNPRNPLLNLDKPVTYGPLELTDYYFETKYQEAEGFEGIIDEYTKIGKELSEITGNKYPLFEGYKIKDAEVILIVLSSSAGTVKEVVEEYRKEGKKVGILKPKVFRPFPYKEIYKAISHAKVVGVMDRSMSRGAFPPLASDIKSAINTYKEGKNIPDVVSHIFGLGGRDLFKKDVEIIFDNLLNNKYNISKIDYIGVRK